jgi:hypothetical protein
MRLRVIALSVLCGAGVSVQASKAMENSSANNDVTAGQENAAELIRAKNWSLTPSMTVGELYSDNIDLAPKGEETDDFVFQFIPALTAELNGRRLQAKLDYRMENYVYKNSSPKYDEPFHQYEASGKAELWRERFFVDLASALTQRYIDTGRSLYFSNASITDNRTDQLTASIRPYWQQPLGDVAEALVRYEYGIVNFDKDNLTSDISDSRLNNITLSLSNLIKDQRLSWSLDVERQTIDYNDDEFDDLEFKRTKLDLGYRITPSIGIIVAGGYEDNDLGSSFTSEEPKGAIWEGGALWQPNPRSKIEARFGHRFFGYTSQFAWTQELQRFTTRIRYSKDIGGETGYLLQGTRSLIDSPTTGIPIQRLSVTGNVYIRKRLDASVTFNTIKSELSLTASVEDRDFDQTSDSEHWRSLGSSWKWKLLPRSSINTGLQLGQYERVSGVEDKYLRASLELERQLGPKTTGSLEYAYTHLNSNESLREYDENSLSLFINRTF